jgi:hypothetical protein
VIQPPRKVKKKVTVTEKTIARGKANGERFRKLNAERKRKLDEYDKIVAAANLNKNESSKLIESKFTELLSAVETLKVSAPPAPAAVTVFPPLPEIIPIKEEDDVYVSEGGSEYKRISTRFNKNYETTGNRSRFRG